MRAGGGLSPPPITAPTVAMACSAVKMPSPVAVRSANCSLSSAALVASRLVVGDTSTVAVPAYSISPRLIPGVSSSANCLAASWAAAIRLGWTSVERIDCDTSITSITTARLRGIRTSFVGPAIAMVNSTNDEHQQDRRHMPPRRRPLGGDAFQQLHVGEAQHPPVARQLHHDVQRGQPSDGKKEKEVPGVREAGQRHRPQQRRGHVRIHPVYCRPAMAPRRRDSTKRTMSAIQSRSVRSVINGAPQLRTVRATSAR